MEQMKLRLDGLLSIIGAIALLAQPALGAVNVANGQATFTLSAPQASTVALLGDMVPYGANPIAMTADAQGVWSVTLPLNPDWYAYQFVLNGVRIPDPENRNIWVGQYEQRSFVLVPGPESEFLADRPVPHGTVATVRYSSTPLGTERQMQVYTPPGYGDGSQQRFPLLVLQHGGGGNDTDWIVAGRANFILDNLLAADEIEPTIVVMPDGNLGGFFMHPVQDPYPQELLSSVIPVIEQHYRIAQRPERRALAGLSMGGLQTLATLLKEPDAFGYVGVMSSGWFPDVVADLDTNYSTLLSNAAVGRGRELLWLSVGGPTDIAYANNFASQDLLTKYGVDLVSTDLGSGGHTWKVWRENLRTFAPLLFRPSRDHGRHDSHR